MESLLERLNAHMSATALKRMSSPVLSCEQIKHNLIWFISFNHLLGYVLQNRTFQKSRKTYRKTPLPEFLSDKVVHQQACNFNQKRLQLRYFTMNFAKLFGHIFYRTPPVSVSHFNSTFLILILQMTHIYIFQALLGLRYF